MKLAISPCPNDTYLFYAWIAGRVGEEINPEAAFADIEQLNRWALKLEFPLIKISMGCFSQVQANYELLPVGTAVGYECGPKIISKAPFSLDDLSRKTIAIPGQHTTAHLLLKKLLPEPQKKRFCLYHEIESLLDSGEVDCGLIIHESRFTYAAKGFVEIVDLGVLWHARTHAPLPLGGLAIARNSPAKERVTSILQESLLYAKNHLPELMPFILMHAQVKDPKVALQHIQTYVTDDTMQLSQKAQHAIDLILESS